MEGSIRKGLKNMKSYRVGILGATGAVGREMMKILAERNFPLEELRLLASEKSVGKTIVYPGDGKEYPVQLACDSAFKGLNIVLGAAANPVAIRFRDSIVKAGALFIDNSSAFRMDEDVPLVVPEINPEDIFRHHGVIANPNCSTIITLMAVKGINKLSHIKGMYVSTYQATSGAGINGPIELMDEMADLVEQYEGDEIPMTVNTVTPKTFAYQIAGNVIPAIGGDAYEGYTKEEMKMQNEGRKILHLPKLLVDCTCVRVPVVRSHAISATIITEKPLTVDEVKAQLGKEDGVVFYDNLNEGIYPMPIITSDQDLVYVGRVRKDLVNPNGITLFCCGDQVRKGAASNAVDIAVRYIQGK